MMKLLQLFESVILNAQEAKDYFERGAENEAFQRLHEIVKTIELLDDFKTKYAALISSSSLPIASPASSAMLTSPHAISASIASSTSALNAQLANHDVTSIHAGHHTANGISSHMRPSPMLSYQSPTHGDPRALLSPITSTSAIPANVVTVSTPTHTTGFIHSATTTTTTTNTGNGTIHTPSSPLLTVNTQNGIISSSLRSFTEESKQSNMIKSPNKRSAPKLDSFTKLRKVTLSSNDKDSSNHAHHSPSHHHIHHQHSPHTPHQHQHQHQPIAPALHTNSFSNGLFSVHTTTNPAEAALIENGLMLPSPTQSLSGTGLIPINSTGTSSTSPTATTASSTTTTVSSSSPVSGNGDNSELDPRLVAQMDRIFYDFLQGLCSNLNASDSRGDPIHQTLMAKKMHKMDQSTDFRPFKFRIQAFSNAFMEALARQGYDQTILPTRKVKQYLWRQKCISRFNEEGRKSKSKGNHVWNIEAKKLPSGSWIFREFSRRITGNPPREAYIGLRYCYTPRIWDPQMQSPKAVFHSPWLPDWLHWENNQLTGIPTETSSSCDITIIATYYHGPTVYKLEKTFYIEVTRLGTVELPVDVQQSLSNFQLPSVTGMPSELSTNMSAAELASAAAGIQADTLANAISANMQ